MSLAIVIDMNLSQEWVALLTTAGYSAVHWSSVGAIDAEDSEIMTWAAANKQTVFTHDLDFGTALALTRAPAPAFCKSARNACCRSMSEIWSWQPYGNTRRNLPAARSS